MTFLRDRGARALVGHREIPAVDSPVFSGGKKNMRMERGWNIVF